MDIPNLASMTIKLENKNTAFKENINILDQAKKKKACSINISIRIRIMITWCQFFIMIIRIKIERRQIINLIIKGVGKIIIMKNPIKHKLVIKIKLYLN
jgi:hypothetical protein